MEDRAQEQKNPLLKGTDDILQRADPLNIDLDDKVLARVLNKKIKDSYDYFSGQKVYEKQDKNKDYVMGKQWSDEERVKYNRNPYQDNIFYEAEGRNKAIATSRVPQLIIKPYNDSDQAKMDAEALTKVFQDEMKKRKERQVLGVVYKHVPVYYIGAIKPIWNPELGHNGDYEFINIHPKLLIIDSNANSLDTTKHKILGHYMPITVEECIMRFPDKEKKLLEAVGIDKKSPSKEQMGTNIKIAELMFDWYERSKEDPSKWTKITAICWKFRSLILGKMKDPNWDWEGEERLFTYDLDKMQKQQPHPDQLKDALMHNVMTSQVMPGMPQVQGMQMQLPQGMKKETVYRNHFQSPRKNLILVGYDQWGEMVYDQTSNIEQGINLQDNVNIRGKQITEIAARSRGKDIFSIASGLKKKDIENLDLRDPNTDLLVKGNPREVHEHIDGEQPSQALFQDQEQNRNRLFSMLGVNSTTRGINDKNVKANKQAQTLKEQDFGWIDDRVDETVNYAAEQMADWRMQFIKLRYTIDHFKSILGPEGETTFYRINRDMVQDGMEPVITASSVDKMMRKNDAYMKLKMKAIDMLTFYEDIDDPNPKVRAERWYLMNKNPDLWYMKVVKGQSMQDMAGRLQQTSGNPGQQPNQPVIPAGQQPPQQM